MTLIPCLLVFPCVIPPAPGARHLHPSPRQQLLHSRDLAPQPIQAGGAGSRRVRHARS